MFRRHQTSQEVQAGLIARNVRLSNSKIAYLGRKFITLLAAGHKGATPRIRQAMTVSGGYVLHLDATHGGDAPAPHHTAEPQTETGPMLPGFQKFIGHPTLPEQMAHIFSRYLDGCKSNWILWQ